MQFITIIIEKIKQSIAEYFNCNAFYIDGILTIIY